MTTLRLEQLYKKISSLRSDEFSAEPEKSSIEEVVYEDLLSLEKLLIRELRKRKTDRIGREDKLA